jgi:hypothetical protein
MRRYHFHVFDGQNYAFDGDGMMLPDLTAVVGEAERSARSQTNANAHVQDWSNWKIDVRGEDDITIFFYPFEELTKPPKAVE